MAKTTFGNSLFDFYKIMSPLNVQHFQAKKADPAIVMLQKLKDTYITTATAGKEIVTEIDAAEHPYTGYYFNTINQSRTDTISLNDKDAFGKPTAQRANAYFAGVGDFYNDVCGGKGAPPVDITINILRTSGLTEATRNVDEIEFFLNHMPSIFPSQMSPYLNVEIEFPNTIYDDKKGKLFINRPSLERFLMGSLVVGDPIKSVENKYTTNLTTVDLALMSVIKTGKQDDAADRISNFMGMEMFTSPQTLINMDQLDKKTGVRLNSVKPFLPPATILSATVQIRNAGAGTFLHKTVDLELKIHDKARLPEFSEFLRGPSGTQNVIVWLTYGWLSPRKGDDQDYYAKFINENMLVREAFEVKNSSFSFDVVGQVTVKIELVSKGVATADTARINNALSDAAKLQVEDLQYIKNHRDLFGKQTPDAATSLKIYQVFDAAEAGSNRSGMTPAEFGDTINAAKDFITNNASLTPDAKNQANQVINRLAKNYDITEGAQNSKIEMTILNEIKHRLQKNFNVCANTIDPFKPRTISSPNKFFSDDLIKSMTVTQTIKNKESFAADQAQKAHFKALADADATGVGEKIVKNGIASFGKLFCVFCMDTLANQAKLDGIDEVQINFYQLNESCGPVSLQSIAEFPIDLDAFKVQFAEFCMQRGGESINMQEFLKFTLESQFLDHRAPGYGMREYYEPFDASPAHAESLAIDDAAYQKKMGVWLATYGEFKMPDISFKIETVFSGATKSKVDLLQHLQSDVGSAYKNQVINTTTTTTTTNKEKPKPKPTKIKKISIYDKQLSPYTDQMQLIESKADTFVVYNGPALEADATLKKRGAGDAAAAAPVPTTGREVLGGVNVLKEYLNDTVPTLTIGANGSLITSITLASKTSGLIGTNNIQGGSANAPSTLSPNGLSMSQNSLPVRLAPAQLTMTSLGCPIADLYQQYFVDFGTGTTIDNLYAVTQLTHTITPGKFETSWTFAYADGYGKFFSAPKLSDYIKK